MKYAFIFMTLLCQISAYSKVSVVRKGTKLYLSGPTCEELNNRTLAMNQWAKAIGEWNNYKPACACLKKGCFVEVSKIGPQLYKEYEGVTPVNLGSNCFSAALVGNKILPSLGYTSYQEIEFWLRSNLCVKVPPKSSKSPGDIIHISDPAVTPRAKHSFTYIAPDLAFSKNGIGGYVSPGKVKNYPYELLHPDEVYNHPGFQVKPECIDVTNEQAKELNCKNQVQFYRCDTIAKYLSKNPLPMEIAQTWHMLKETDRKLSDLFIHNRGKIEDKKELYLFVWKTINLSTRMLSEKRGKEAFLWQAIKHRAESLESQYKMIKE